jgi:hypothetical protein
MNKAAERRLLMKGYIIEWSYSPRGTQVCKAYKEGVKPVYAKTLISLEKAVIEKYGEQ